MWAGTPRQEEETRTRKGNPTYAGNVISAECARSLRPSFDISAILSTINDQIIAKAEQGCTETNIISLLPDYPLWRRDLVLELRRDLYDKLRAAGYEIKTHAGGHASREEVIVSWGKN